MLSRGFTLKGPLIVAADCRVDYQGRSSSTLEWGERLIIIKADGAVLVHQLYGYEPVNWQPPGCILSCLADNDDLVLRATRRSPREVLSITLRSIYLITFMKMVDTAKIDMLLTEKDLYEVISKHPDLIEPGLRILSSQRSFKRGFADFTGIDHEGRYVVLEVKKDSAGTNAVKQLYKYVSDMRKNQPSIRGILAASRITREAVELAKSLDLQFTILNLKRCTDLFRSNRIAGELDSHMY